MAKYQIMYWKDIPAQVKAMDGKEEFSAPLPPRFQEVIDEIAMRNGELNTDAYLDGWQWGEIKELSGIAKEIAQQIVAQIDAQYPQNNDELLKLFQNIQKDDFLP